MPRFFINVDYVSAQSKDDDGALFENHELALRVARLVIGELLVEAIRSDAAKVPQRVWVMDENMCEVGAVRLADVVAADRVD